MAQLDTRSTSGATRPLAKAKDGHGSVLVIEDDDDSREGMRLRLEAEGYRVAFAIEGTNAIAMIQKTNPDVIVLDLGLPGANGFDVLRRLQLVKPRALKRVIVLSAWDEQTYKPQALDAGARFYLQKPVPHEDLKHALQTIACERLGTDESD